MILSGKNSFFTEGLSLHVSFRLMLKAFPSFEMDEKLGQ
jgi:hypothetical protein